MYFISSNYNSILDVQAHETNNPKIIKHPSKVLFAIQISKNNICKDMQVIEKLPEDWRCTS